jgi:HK97 gp10 family phage protein
MTQDGKKRGQELAKKLRDFGYRAETNVEKAILKGAMQVEKDAKDNRREGGNPTGYLLNSITHQMHTGTGGGAYALVGSNAEYATFVEKGTSKMAPQPYLTPAYDKNINANKADIALALAESVREAFQS